MPRVGTGRQQVRIIVAFDIGGVDRFDERQQLLKPVTQVTEDAKPPLTALHDETHAVDCIVGGRMGVNPYPV